MGLDQETRERLIEATVQIGIISAVTKMVEDLDFSDKTAKQFHESLKVLLPPEELKNGSLKNVKKIFAAFRKLQEAVKD